MKKIILPICSAILFLSACSDDAGQKPADECTTNDWKCDVNQLMKCNNGTWEVQESCTETQQCNAINHKCDNKITCKENEIVADDGGCVCDGSKGYYGEKDACQLCEGTGKTIHGNACTCDAENHWMLSGNECVCDEAKGYTYENGECKLCEGTGKTIQGNDCTCDAENHWMLSGNECVCDEAKGYTNENGECKLCEGTGKIIQGNACTCDAKNHWVLSGNECVCDEANHWKLNGNECVECDGVILSGNCVKKGDIFKFGEYFQSNDTEKEPIEWRILDIDSDRQALFLLSEYVLDSQSYNELGGGRSSWKDCTLREWLNGTFMSAAFSTSEQAAILETHLENPDTGTDGSDDTNDKIFLLSLSDVYGEDSNYKDGKWYFDNNADRKAMATKYLVVNKGAYASYDETSCNETNFQVNKCSTAWWLRLQGKVMAASVRTDGSIALSIAGTTNIASLGVRPALYVSTELLP